MENISEKYVTVEQLHEKEVINIIDGKRLGYPCDVMFDLCNGKIIAIIVPSGGGFMGLGGKREDITVYWDNIEKIGKDIILVKCLPGKRDECDNEECKSENEKKKRFFC